MLPFQTAPLAAPLRNRSIIVPLTLVYKSVDDKAVSKANRDLIYCYDEMDFMPHFWKLLSLRSIEAVVTVQPKIECFRYSKIILRAGKNWPWTATIESWESAALWIYLNKKKVQQVIKVRYDSHSERVRKK